MIHHPYTTLNDDEVEIDYVVTRQRRCPPFIKGPIPLPWLESAAGCSPAAVKIGLLLFYHHGMGKTQITISNEQARRMKISRNTKSAALNALEKAGLVKLERVGQKVVITLRDSAIGKVLGRAGSVERSSATPPRGRAGDTMIPKRPSRW